MSDNVTTMSLTYQITPGFVFAQNKGIGYLLSESESIAVSNPLYRTILLSIDGIKTDTQIVSQLEGEFGDAQIYYAFLKLEEAGYIKKIDRNQDSGLLQVVEETELKELDNVSVYISGVDVDTTYIDFTQSILFQAGGGEKSNTECSIDVILCRDYLDDKLVVLYDTARQNGRYFYPIKISGNKIWFGPLFSPHSQPCWHCLNHRLGSNRPVLMALKRNSTDMNIGLAPNLYPSNARTGIHLGMSNLFNLISRKGHTSVKPVLVSCDLQEMVVEKHPVVNRPQCPVCGRGESDISRYSKPVKLQACCRAHTAEGGYRSITPAETWERYRHLVSPITGIVGKVEPLQARNHPLRPVWHALYFRNPGNINTIGEESLVQVSFGKGCSIEQARASALCEAIERYSAQYQGVEPEIRGTYSQLKGENAVDPRVLMNFSETQYKNRHLFAGAGKTLSVPLPFHEELEISWTQGWSLTNERHCLVPLSFCYAYTPTPPHENVCPFCTNGNAAGNTREEAILQGILELVERDATAIWWYNCIPRPEVSLESFNDPYFVNVKDSYLNSGWELSVIDLTHDLKIPTTVSIAHNTETGYNYIGFGSHLDMRLAVQRSITELNQIFDPEGKQTPVWTDEDLDRYGFLYKNPDMQKVNASDYRLPPGRDITDDIRYCINILQNKGLELIVVDYTRPDIGLPAVKVIIPGMRHFWKRVGPGRLYDVPVAMGWLEQTTLEEELNPVPIFL